MSARSVLRQQLRQLLWLKWRLTLRGFQRSRSSLIGLVLSVVLILPFALLIAFGSLFVYHALLPPYREYALRAVLLGAYQFWLIAPLFGYALNDSYDITRLFVYPVRLPLLFLGVVLGSLFDFPIIFLLPTLITAVSSFTTDLFSGIVTACALALFLLHTLSLSQAFLLVSRGILVSRKFREMGMVGISILWILYYIGSQTLVTRAGSVDWRALAESPGWKVIAWLPPGLAARAAAASTDARAESLLVLALLAAATLGSGALATWLIGRAYRGDTSAARLPVRGGGLPEQSARPHRLGGRIDRTSGLLPPVVQAIVYKETRYFLREPYFKMAILNIVYILCVGIFAVVRPGRGFAGAQGPRAMCWFTSALLLLGELQLVCNVFGPEGVSASMLFLFPCPRRQILLGKNLALFGTLSMLNITAVTLLAAVADQLAIVGLLICWMELALLALMAVGNLMSIYLPYRVVMRGWRLRQQSASRGCGYSFIYLGAAVGAMLLLVPALAALAAPLYWIEIRWLALTLPLGILYAFGLYGLSLWIGVPLLSRREPEIIAALSQPDE